ncbi:MAG: aldehyde ferredoxin oxidoreductase family protein [Candidatus Hodarchaeota archaeon]
MNEDYRLLRVNLTTRKFQVEEIPEDILKSTIGGKGLGSKILLEEVKAKIDPLGPDNKIIFVGGPLTGTNFPTGNRYGILYKSPLTGTYAESYSGGGVAQKMRAAGYFSVIIEGSANSPEYIFISEKGVEFRDATHLWGKDTLETYEALQAHVRKELDILSIGPAGENLVKIANVQNNKYHSAGRCGPGALMGSKNLKAIVFSGNKRPTLNKKPAFKQLVQDILRFFKDKPLVYGPEGLYRKFGTPIIVDWTNELGCFPTRYYSQGFLEESEKISAHALIDEILVRRVGCWNCPFTCGKHSEIKEGSFKGIALEGPEYETIANFGGLCDIRDIKAIAGINEYCDRVGIDTISAGALCALAIESKLRKRIPGIDTLNINYKDPESVLAFVKAMVNKEGFGAEFGNGTRFVEEKYGLQDYAMQVKGLEFAGYDPRAFRGFAISYGVAPEGPTHLRSTYHGIEHTLPLSYEDRVLPMIEQEDRMAIIDSLIVCKFIRGALDWDFKVDLYNAIYDEEIDVDGLRKISTNMITLSRKFNVREGFTRKDDYLPERVYKEPLIRKDGEPFTLDREKYGKMLDEYYTARGWSEDGIPN